MDLEELVGVERVGETVRTVLGVEEVGMMRLVRVRLIRLLGILRVDSEDLGLKMMD